MKLISYRRVSTEQQGDSGLGLGAQLDSIERYTNAHGHNLVLAYADTISSRKDKRHGWDCVIQGLESGMADGVIVAKLDRISRSVQESVQIFAKFKAKGWTLIALDLGVDTSTPAGKLVATVMAAVAEWERDTISQRTKDALAQKKKDGIKLGRPHVPISDVAKLGIETLLAKGYTPNGIAKQLNDLGVESPTGKGLWYGSTVKRAITHYAML